MRVVESERKAPTPPLHGVVRGTPPVDGSAPVLRVLLVGSSGGHLDQLLLLDDWLTQQDVAVATFLKPDAAERVARWRSYALHWPTNRNLRNLLRNTVVAFRVLRTERPDVVISSGAASAVPFFLLAKPLAGATTVFVECYDRLHDATLTAKLVKRMTDMFVVQWPTQLRGWPHRVDLGPSR